jgi:hypothetical protein
MCGCVVVWLCGCVGVYTKSKTSELSPLRCVRIKVAIMCLQAIHCNIQEFCCNWLQGVTWSYMALQDHLVSVTAIFFHVICKLPVT